MCQLAYLYPVRMGKTCGSRLSTGRVWLVGSSVRILVRHYIKPTNAGPGVSGKAGQCGGRPNKEDAGPPLSL